MEYNVQTVFFEHGEIENSFAHIKEVPLHFYEGSANIWGYEGKFQASYIGGNVSLATEPCPNEALALATLEWLLLKLAKQHPKAEIPKRKTNHLEN